MTTFVEVLGAVTVGLAAALGVLAFIVVVIRVLDPDDYGG
jgi:hypothetical protein